MNLSCLRLYGLYRASRPSQPLSRPGIVLHPRDLDLPGCADFFYILNVAYKLPAKPACFMGVLGCTLPGLLARFEVEVQTIDPRTCSVEPLGEACRGLERRRVSIYGSGVGE
jgi:hypothetical protein